VKIGAMEKQIRRAEALLDFAAELELARDFTGIPFARKRHCRLEGDAADVRFEAEASQHFHGVRRHLDARADARKARRLFVNMDVVSRARQERRGCKPADAGADDRCLHADSPFTPS
jgi:hypothetical protein